MMILAAIAMAAAVSFPTDDGWTIAASYQPPKKGKPVVVMVHGVAAGKGEWDSFAKTLNSRGWGTLAIDLRGHGDSMQGPLGTTDFRGFDTSGDWAKAVGDVMAAAKFLKQKGIGKDRLVLIGASIGANLCSRAVSTLKPRALVLLSPGANYRSVTIGRFDDRHALAAASPGDAYAYETVAKLKNALSGLTVLEATSGHGAQMLSDATFQTALLRWLGL